MEKGDSTSQFESKKGPFMAKIEVGYVVFVTLRTKT